MPISGGSSSSSTIPDLDALVALLTNPANPTYEYNGGGPTLANGTPSGLNTDRRKNAKGKGTGTGTVTATVANDSNLVFSSAPLTMPASAIITLTGGGNPQEDVYASASFAPGAGVVTVALQNNVVYAGHTTATWSAYAPNGPLANHFTADGVGVTAVGFYDPTDTSGTPYVQGQVDANKNIKTVDANSAAHLAALNALATQATLASVLSALQGTLKAAITKTLSAALFTGTYSQAIPLADTGDITGLANYTELFVNINFIGTFTGTSIQFKIQRKDSFGNYITIDSGFTASAANASSPRSIGAGLNVNQSFGNTIKIITNITSMTTYGFTLDVFAK